MPHQSLLEIPILQPPSFANFVTGNNQQIIDLLADALEKLKITEKSNLASVLLSGKTPGHTHILKSLFHSAQQANIKAVYLSLTHLQNPELVLADLDKNYQLILLNHLESCCGTNFAAEQALFSLFNNIWSQSKLLVLACSTVFDKLTFQLTDLKTRMQSGLIWQLQPLNDEQQKQLLQQRIKRYGLSAKDRLINYLWHRIPRDERLQISFIDKLVTEALETKQKISFALAKKILRYEEIN